MTPLSPNQAAIMAGWEGDAHNLRRRMIRYLDRRERVLGIPLWTRGDDGRRTVTEAALRTHCPELFGRAISDLRVEVKMRIERLEARVIDVVDERISGPIERLRKENESTLESLAGLAGVTEKRFRRVESRLVVLERGHQTDRNRP